MTDPLSTAWEAQRVAMGAFLRSQRELANMSLRELSRATQVSNAYLSQVERGMHDPTLKVLLQIGDALDVSVDDMLERAGRASEARGDRAASSSTGSVEDAIRADPDLTESQREALITVYRSYKAASTESSSRAARTTPTTTRQSVPRKRTATRSAGSKPA